MKNFTRPERLMLIFVFALVLSAFSEAADEVDAETETKTKLEVKEVNTKLPKGSRLKNPSRVSLGYTSFKSPKLKTTESTSIPLKSLYTLSSHIYPFGEGPFALGLGIDFSFLKSEITEQSNMGPLGLSARMLLLTKRSFDVEAYSKINMNTLSDEELKESLLGRDIYKIGISFSKKGSLFYAQNDLEFTAPSETHQTVGNIDYKYKFGSIYTARIKTGLQHEGFRVGGFGEIILADNFKVEGGAFPLETGRNRILAAGPEISWNGDDFGLDIYGRFLVDSTKDTDFDFLGDLMGQGVGQGQMGIRLNIFF